MNINEALYQPEKVRQEIDSRMRRGMMMDEAIRGLADEVARATAEEGRRGVIHGEVVPLEREHGTTEPRT